MITALFDKKGSKIVTGLALAVTLLHISGSVAKYFIYYKGSVVDLLEVLLFCCLMIFAALYIANNTKNNEGRRRVKDILRQYFCKEQILLSILFLLTLISCIVLEITSGESYLQDNLDCISDLIICIFVIFPSGRLLVKNDKNIVIKTIIHILLFAITCFMLLVLYKIVVGDIMETVNGGHIGMLDYGNGAYQLSINCHPNTVGSYSGVFFLACVCLSVLEKKALRYICIFEALIHFIILALSNSRGSLFAAMISFGGILGLVTFHNLNKWELWKKVCVSVIVGIISIFALYFLRNGILLGFDKITSLSTVSEIEADNIQEDQYVAVRDMNLTYVNFRGTIWKKAIDLITDNPKTVLFGVSPRSVSKVLGKALGADNDIYTHNQLLEVGLATGIPSLLIFFVFIVFLAIDCFFIEISRTDKEKWKSKVFPMILLFLVIGNVMEALLLYHNYFSGCVFMLISGWCENQARIQKKTEK